jgi:hypothetical protein
MKVLVACESSGVVRDAFTKRGHDATSCDLEPSETEGKHYQGNVLDILGQDWDLLIAHPPCTYLCSSGLHWNYKYPERDALTEEAIQFAHLFIESSSHIPKRAIENPIGCLSTRIRKPDQIIQPYQFGHDASKKTCLWLVDLPKLVPTSYVEPRVVNNLKRWANQTDSGQNKLAPSASRWKERSRTYEGIAEAMADQWS